MTPKERRTVLECVVNISEGRQAELVQAVANVAGTALLDVHTDPHHNRSVLTLVGEDAPREVAEAAVKLLDLRQHDGVHPRIGIIDVVPFVPLADSTMADAVAARDRFIEWIADELEVPAFCYGPERTLPDIRRHAFVDLAPDAGPPEPHPTAGAVAVGARQLLVAWNIYLAEPDLSLAKQVAKQIRGPHLRALGLAVGDRVQVSMNLIAPDTIGPAEAWNLVAQYATPARAELVGLIPQSVLARVPKNRQTELDLSNDRTIEFRLTGNC